MRLRPARVAQGRVQIFRIVISSLRVRTRYMSVPIHRAARGLIDFALLILSGPYTRNYTNLLLFRGTVLKTRDSRHSFVRPPPPRTPPNACRYVCARVVYPFSCVRARVCASVHSECVYIILRST